MSVEGIVQNGLIVLPDGKPFHDGTVVRVEPAPPVAAKTLAERYASIIGIIDDLPADMAENHDHYLHGAPKK